MSQLKPAATVTVTVAVVAALLFPAGVAVGLVDSGAATQEATNETALSVEVGEQLSTVVTTTSAEIRTEAENVGFDQRFEQANATERSELITQRAAELENRSAELKAAYTALTESYQQGEVWTDEYAQRIAALSGTATNVEKSTARLELRAADLPDAERRAVDITEDDLAEITAGINPLTGKSAAAVLGQFTEGGASEIEIEVGDRIELSVESDGERSRQFERPREDDDSNAYEINQSTALDIAETELSQPADEWALTGVSTGDGVYEFEFAYQGPGEGEADVSVDGSSGTIFEFEESIEAPGDDDVEESGVEDLSIRVVDGEPAPGANVTLAVTGGGERASNASVQINDERVGQTDADGQIAVTLPDAEEIDIGAELNDAEGELEFEFEEEDDEELAATADIEGDTITVSVLLDGQPVEGATVTLNENVTNTTSPDGTTSFTFAENELEIDIEYDDHEAELEYELDEEEKEEEEDSEGDEEESDDEEETEDSEEDDKQEEETQVDEEETEDDEEETEDSEEDNEQEDEVKTEEEDSEGDEEESDDSEGDDEQEGEEDTEEETEVDEESDDN